jgi:mannose-1-phosphate guanylyltransferase
MPSTPQDPLPHSYAVIIAGGSGTRLWPLSRKARPKQFQALAREATMLQHIFELANTTVPAERILVMATPEFADLIRQQIPQLPAENLLFEPMRRDNGPAIALAMLQVHLRDPQATVALLWSDQNIENPEAFAKILGAGYQVIANHPRSMLMLGAKPTHPETGFGYIQMGQELESYDEVPLFKVKRFAEKPDLATATRYVASWEYLWNSGLKFMAASQYVAKFREFHPELHSVLDRIIASIETQNLEGIEEAYADFPKLSDEYLFTQHMTDLLVIPADVGWSDIGNWATLHDILKSRSGEALVSRGPVISLDSTNTLVFAKDRPIAICGLKDIVIVDDGDAILVMHKNCASRIKELNQLIEASNPELL